MPPVRVVPLVLGLLLFLALPAGAAAAQRFVSPTGAGSACSAAQPCALATGAGAAASGDEVLVAPGAYSVAALGVSAGVDVHGAVGGPAPVVTITGDLTVAGRLADVAVWSSGPVVVLPGFGERLDVRQTAAQAAVIIGRGGFLANSAVVSAGNAIAWFGYDARFDLRNVTAIAGASGYGLYMNALPGPMGSQSLGVVRNSVFHGGLGDLTKVGPLNQTLQVSHSSFATSTGVTDQGGNVGAAALFGLAAGDLHQAPGSPTIDAGTADAQSGAVDLDGRPRTVGSAIDMGAYEAPGVPGPPPPQPAGNLLVNPGADAAAGAADAATDVAIPGWTTTPAFTAVQYGAAGGFPGTAEAQRNGGGPNFFAGGPANPSSTARQTVDVGARAGEIDAGVATVRLAGDLGGWSTNGDATTVTATFRDAANAAVGTVAIGPVTAVDRGGASIFLRREATAPVPAGTRRIEVTISASNAGGTLTYNDAYADNLSLTVAVPPPPVAPTGPAGPAGPAVPGLSALQLAPSTVRPGGTTTLRVTLDRAARLRILVQRAQRGTLRRGRCVAPRRGLKGRRCTRWSTVRTVSAAGRAGANAIRIALKSGRRALPAGTYRLRVSATGDGGTSAPVTLTLRIRRSPR